MYFKGYENKLVRNFAWTCETICYFNYGWYPFDTQSCGIYRMISDLYEKLQLKTGTISYSGTGVIGKYYFRDMNYCQINKFGKSGIFIDLIFSRPLTGNLMTIFLPTGMLLMISQMSVVFSSSFLDIVIEVNTTLLLVLTTM